LEILALRPREKLSAAELDRLLFVGHRVHDREELARARLAILRVHGPVPIDQQCELAARAGPRLRAEFGNHETPWSVIPDHSAPARSHFGGQFLA
jgi:hypothetical protein